MKTFKVRVVKAGSKAYWYADKIDREFDVTDCNGGYHTRIGGSNGLGGYFNKSDCVIVEDTMEYTKNGKTYRQLKDITVKALIKLDAPDEDIDSILGDYYYTEPISLRYAIDHASSCNEKLQWLVDQGFVEVVEEGYEVKLGDRYTFAGSRKMLCVVGWMGPGLGETIQLISVSGTGYCGTPVEVKNTEKLTIKDFRSALHSFDDQWNEIHATRIPFKQ